MLRGDSVTSLVPRLLIVTRAFSRSETCAVYTESTRRDRTHTEMHLIYLEQYSPTRKFNVNARFAVSY